MCDPKSMVSFYSHIYHTDKNPIGTHDDHLHRRRKPIHNILAQKLQKYSCSGRGVSQENTNILHGSGTHFNSEF